MASKIEWTDETWNPVSGCTPVSPGCDHCYAAAMAKRFAGRNGYPSAPRQFDVTLHPDRLTTPLRWRRPRRVFVVSMGDLFHDSVPDEFLDRVFAVMDGNPRHVFQVLTKRPARLLAYLTAPARGRRIWEATAKDEWRNTTAEMRDSIVRLQTAPLVFPNVWLGVTAEDQQRADERIPLLLQTPAALRFVSCEPLLGAVDLTRWLHCTYAGERGFQPVQYSPSAPQLDWVICGGETGPGARPMHPDWARGLREQCAAAGVPFFFKRHSQDNSPRQGQSMDAARLAHTLDGAEHHAFPEAA